MINLYSLLHISILAKRQELQLPQTRDKVPNPEDISSLKIQSPMPAGHDSCYLVKLNTQSQDFLVRLDTGSSDTVLPGQQLNNYAGPEVTYSPTPGQALATNSYGDKSFWNGYQTNMQIGVSGTSVSATCPIIVMTSQSTNPIFSSGSYGSTPDGTNGLIGVGFPILARQTSGPRTVLDAMFQQGKIQNNAISIYGCPYGSFAGDSWVDFGNETPYVGCGGYKVTIGIPSPSYYNLNITAFAVQGVKQPLPSVWQTGYSILDSCTTAILLPSAMHAALVAEIKRTSGLSTNLKQNSMLDSWLAGNVGLLLSSTDIDYFNLPSISFTIASQATNYQTITLTLGPRQYIQTDSNGQLTYVYVSPWDKDHMILGLPVFSSYQIMADLTENTVTFRPGCGCTRRLDQYPKFFIDEKPVCTCSPDPIFPGAGPNATTTTAPPSNTQSCTCQDSVFTETPLPSSASPNPRSLVLVLGVMLMHLL